MKTSEQSRQLALEEMASYDGITPLDLDALNHLELIGKILSLRERREIETLNPIAPHGSNNVLSFTRYEAYFNRDMDMEEVRHMLNELGIRNLDEELESESSTGYGFKSYIEHTTHVVNIFPLMDKNPNHWRFNLKLYSSQSWREHNLLKSLQHSQP